MVTVRVGACPHYNLASGEKCNGVHVAPAPTTVPGHPVKGHSWEELNE